jgi:membrane protein DedA with SNARE-associated domain
MNPIVYLSIFIGAALEGELVLVSAIQAVRNGYVDFYAALLAFFLGTFCTDWFYFISGKKQGRRLLERHKKLSHKASQIDQLMARYGVLLLVSYRFIYGFRIVLPLLFGMSGLSNKKFLFFSLLSTSIWLSVYGWTGYFFTDWLLQQVNSGRALLLVLAISLFVFLSLLIRNYVFRIPKA